MTTAKQKLMALCELCEIGVEHEKRGPYHHFHVYAPAGKRFSGFEVDNLSLWDGDDGAPNWASCLADLKKALPLEDDPEELLRSTSRLAAVLDGINELEDE